MKVVAALVPLLLACTSQDAGKVQEAPDAKWKISFALSIVEKEGKWVFRVDGVTNLPAEVKLRARIYALETFTDFKEGEREDDEPLVWEDDNGQPSYHIFNPENGGQIHEEVYKFVRKPYSIRYRAKIHYNPRDQNDKMTLLVGDEEFFRKADLRFGTDADYALELKERVKEVAADLVALEKLYGDFVEQYPAFLKDFNAAGWSKWKEPWLERIEEIEKRNDTRYSLWAVWMERQAKMRVGGMCELLARRMIGAAEGHFFQNLKTEERVQELIKGFHDYFEEAIEVIGVNAPLDPRTVVPLVNAYDGAMAPLRQWISDPKGDGSAVLKKARKEGVGALLQLAPLLQNRKRGYLYVNVISARFSQLLELIDAKPGPDVLKKGMQDHDDALAEFKKFAGIK